MIHGRKTKTHVNTRSKKQTHPLTPSSSKDGNSLASRVARLEARVEQMQEQLDRASGVLPTYFQEALESNRKKHPGPHEQIEASEILLRRDAIVKWLEEQWPNVVQPLLAAHNPRAVAAAMKKVASPLEIRPEWQRRLVGHPAKLLEFLNSEKFRIKPPRKTVVDALNFYSEKRSKAANRLPTRQIANAMAGVPELKWRTSLDKCSKNPSPMRVGYNTATHYRTAFGIPDEKLE